MSCNKNQSCPNSPRNSLGRLSPTSDFVEDSSISEDNSSLINASADHMAFQNDSMRSSENYGGGMVHNLAAVRNHVNGTTNLNVSSSPRSPSAIVTEYKAVMNTYIPSSLSITSSGSSGCNTTSPSHSNSNISSGMQHYNHKKYLREEYTKQVKQEAAGGDTQEFASPVNYRYIMTPKIGILEVSRRA